METYKNALDLIEKQEMIGIMLLFLFPHPLPGGNGTHWHSNALISL
jgi:hypothetical protein